MHKFSSNVKVENSAGHGILLESMNDTISLMDLNITNSRLDGIYLSTLKESAKVRNLHLQGI